ncbi:MAG: EAL domain-containing protein, partial [Gammaproteobacteria bacterium]|nr:EAL domain-containing protein [Gammaproteobacteria bacterium]
YWIKSSTEKVRYIADSYHLLSSSNYMAAMEELRHIENQMSLELATDAVDANILGQLTETREIYRCQDSAYIAQQKISSGQELGSRFSDNRFDYLERKLRREISATGLSEDTFCITSEQQIVNIRALLRTLRQIVQLHNVARDEWLLELETRESRQFSVFIILMIVFLYAGFQTTRRGLRKIEADKVLHKRAKEKLNVSESKFNAITNQATEGISVADPEGNYTFVNPAFCDMIGYSEEELLKMTVFDVKAPEQDTSSFQRSKTSEEGLPIDVLLQRKDGSVFVAEVIGKMIEIDGQPQVLGTVRDIDEQIKVEEHIRKLSMAIEQSPVSVVISDTDGNIEFVNKAFESITGYTATEANGMNLLHLHADETAEGRDNQIWQILCSGKEWQGELKSRKKSGKTFWEYCHFAPVNSDTGNISHYLAVKEDITIRKQQEMQILQQAHFDSLTGLPNRFLSLDRLSQLLSEAERNDEKVAVLFMDLDDFKKINDTLGHETGDKLLVEAAARIHHALRSGDTVGRLGGDEFLVLLGGLEDAIDARPITEKLLAAFKETFRIDGRELIQSTSIGVAIYPDDGNNASELLRKADSAMYHAKELKRNTYSFFTEAMNRDVSRRLALEEQMHGALGRGEFEVHYQPKIEIASRRVIGSEALLRWKNPALGNVSPVEFIPIAEQTGLIVPIGRFVLAEALANTALWQQNYDAGFRIAVNLSPIQFRDAQMASYIDDAMQKHKLTRGSLELEITEGVLLAGHSFIDERLAELKAIGVTIAMDDFGTGYSSMSYLRKYPFDVLKIDRSFISDITVDQADRELINATIAMAHGLNLKVVAEGVETDGQLKYLKEQGCDCSQGYLFSKPLSADELTDVFDSDVRLARRN